ncbi:retrotransposon protein, putative, ty1-copia subclass [Tanacetum coccineum]
MSMVSRNCPAYMLMIKKKRGKLATYANLQMSSNRISFSFPTKESVDDTETIVALNICNTKQDYRSEKKLKRDLFTCIRGVVSVTLWLTMDLVSMFLQDCGEFSFNRMMVNKRVNALTVDFHFLWDSTYLWHCRLTHINKKRIKQLQQDGLLKSMDDESYDKCESCLSGKMTKKPFSHSNERAKDLLGIIHTDVCGPLRHVSRQGASYFINFTDDYSRYGYVYLLKHKHEFFETFKVFKNEVENQIGKTIKAIRSDRGGEYISQEFKDYLKANGIVQQLTPPYTPQHNGVSERRNRTLLDMVQSMMNHTILPLSFWDYALESATRILNMVPTKKVDKTPY